MTPACGRCGARAIAHVNGVGRQCLMCGEEHAQDDRGGAVAVEVDAESRPRPGRRRKSDCAGGGEGAGAQVQAGAAVGADRRAAGDGLGSTAVASRSACTVGRSRGARRGQADHRVRPLRRNRVAGGAPQRKATTFLPAAGEVQGALLVAAAAAMTTPVKTMTPTRSRSCRWRRLAMAWNGWDGAPKCAFPLCRRPVVPAIESQGVAHVWSRVCGRHGGGPRTIVVSHGDSPAAPRRRFPPLS